jgi:cytosine/adenosine deaminase-related metal-dependent hydrolase
MRLLRARALVPVSGPPVADGAVLMAGGRIGKVGRWRDLRREAKGKPLDLGEVALMPGLVNAHCHLDYTDMAGQLAPPTVFSDWLKLITEAKQGWSLADYQASWTRGAQMLARTGTTTVGDIEAVPRLLPGAWRTTPLRVVSFLEMIGITNRRPPATVLAEANETVEKLSAPGRRLGLSPHAPYSTVPELLRLTARTSRQQRWRLAVHVAESALEFEMFTHGRGSMYDWLKRSGRDMTDCGLGSPVRHLGRCGLLSPRLLAVHVNYLARGDADMLARRGVHVAHCPRSHAYFRHDPFPLRRLARAGVNICLGTDSLATVYQGRRQSAELNLFAEMRSLAAANPQLRGRKILEMASVNGAQALGLEGRAGVLRAGAWADLIAVSFSGPLRTVYRAILEHNGEVAASMIGGRWALAPDWTRATSSNSPL